MATNGTIETGLWIDWSNGRLLGATVTLSAREGAILISFITVLLSFAGAQLWKILVYILHQTWYAHENVDTLKHQQRALLRNSSNPGSTAWTLIQQCLAWRRIGRTLPLALFALLYIAAVAVLSIFAPAKLQATTYRLLAPINCGYWFNNDMGTQLAKTLAMSQAASVYSQNCYESSEPDSLKCQQYPVFGTNFTKDAPCPFAEGWCWTKNTSVPFSMTTRMLDSREDLGINLHDSMSYRSEMTCAVLDDTNDGVIEYLEGEGTGGLADLIRLHWGNSTFDVAVGPTDYTFSYSTLSTSVRVPYTLDITSASPGSNNLWIPLPALNRTDADVTLIMFSPNSVTSMYMVDDPLFSSHIEKILVSANGTEEGTGRYQYDWWTATIGCTEQYQLCVEEKCSDMLSLTQAFSDAVVRQLDLSPAQQAIRSRFYYAATSSTLSSTLNQRSGNALRASQTLAQTVQWNPMPDTQYLSEFASWYTTSLSMFSAAIWSYVNGNGTHKLFADTTEIERDMCYLQRTSSTNGTQAFSLVRVILVICLCTITILISFILEPCVRLIQTHLIPSRRVAAALWTIDETLQLQRHLFEALGHGAWHDPAWLPIPSSKSNVPFGHVDISDKTRPRWTEHVEDEPQEGYTYDNGYGKPGVSVTTAEARYD